MAKSSLAIDARKLSRTFGEYTAVNKIDIQVKEGEIYGFLGPNGAGKSTTIKMLVTLLNPTSGDAFINGESIVKNPGSVRLNIGVALQEAALDEKQTGIEFLKLQSRLYGLYGHAFDRRLKELLQLVDIGEAIGRPIKSYSGGMKRRLDLAAALVHNPSVLFLDEPTTGLDPISRSKVWDEVRRLNNELGMTIFLTTQYLEEADQLADRVGIISKGTIVAEGSPKELKNKIGKDLIVVKVAKNPEEAAKKLRTRPLFKNAEVHNKELTLATANGAKLVSELAIALKELNVKVEELTLRSASLDDVFLEVTGSRLQGNDEEETKK